MKYLHRFKTTEDFNQEFHGDDYKIPWVSVVSANTDTLQYNKTKEQEEEEEKQKTPLTFEIQSDGDIIWKSTSAPTRTIEYSKDNGETWTEITSATGNTAPSISVVSGDTVQFRGNNTAYATSYYYYNCFSGSTCSFSIKGNIMSLINSTDFNGLTNLSGTYNFFGLFSDCTGLTDTSKLLLPATTLTNNCYSNMFNGCTNLTSVPVNYLPVTTLAQSCYFGMFSGCTSLTTAPALPATTLANSCYESMFYGCSSLTTAPALPAEILANSCYYGMFRGCTSLNYIKCLATDISATSCTKYWVVDVQTNSGTFVKNSAMTGWTTGINGIPNNWTVQDAS